VTFHPGIGRALTGDQTFRDSLYSLALGGQHDGKEALTSRERS